MSEENVSENISGHVTAISGSVVQTTGASVATSGQVIAAKITSNESKTSGATPETYLGRVHEWCASCPKVARHTALSYDLAFLPKNYLASPLGDFFTDDLIPTVT